VVRRLRFAIKVIAACSARAQPKGLGHALANKLVNRSAFDPPNDLTKNGTVGELIVEDPARLKEWSAATQYGHVAIPRQVGLPSKLEGLRTLMTGSV
jgi:hypothetical protein